MEIILLWVVGVFIVSCGVAGVSLLINDIVTKWAHAKGSIEEIQEDQEKLSYWRISRLEYELFDQTFHNPDPASYFGPCRCAACRYKVDPIDPKAAEAYAYGLPFWQDREGE